MAKIHNLLNRGNWSAALKRSLGVEKTEGGLERFGETLTPTIELWDQPEWAYLREETLGCIFTGASAVAAEFGFCGIGLPTASRDLLVVERITARAGANCQLGHALRSVIAGTGTASLVSQNRDQRYAKGLTVSRNPPVEVWTGTDPGTVVSLTEEIVPSATTYEEFVSPPHIVKPGGVLLVNAMSVNVLVNTNFVYRVRAALPGELD